MRGLQIGERIAELREWKKETQQELADAIGVKRETVKFWESGDRQIKGRDIIKIAEHFEVSADYILELSPIKSIGADDQAACKVTGLSETVIDALKNASPQESSIISALMEKGAFWSLVSRLCAISDCIGDLKSLYEKAESGTADDTTSKTLLDLYKEIRIHRFEASESMLSAIDEASGYQESGKILESINKWGNSINGKH